MTRILENEQFHIMCTIARQMCWKSSLGEKHRFREGGKQFSEGLQFHASVTIVRKICGKSSRGEKHRFGEGGET